MSEQFLAPSAGVSSGGPVSNQGPCSIQNCCVSPSDFVPSPDPAAPSCACLRVSAHPGEAAHGPAQQPGCEGNPWGADTRIFRLWQSIAVVTTMGCVSRIQAVAMRGCLGIKSSKGGSVEAGALLCYPAFQEPSSAQ